jgi:isopenicillin N synthase-like dioxygenase
MLEKLSNNQLKSTKHRVILNDNEKYSIVFFFEPNIDTMICDIKFKDYIDIKLKELE